MENRAEPTNMQLPQEQIFFNNIDPSDAGRWVQISH